MMMNNLVDIVIPLGKGSIWGDDEELRYALRGFVRHLSGIRNVVIVGELPSWVTGVIHIPCKDKQGHEWRDLNIFNKVMLACNDDRVSDDFLFCNDDHFLNADFEAGAFPYHYRELDMIETIHKAVKQTSWRTCIQNTRDYLEGNGLDVKMFDTHCPILYNKYRFMLLNRVDWAKPYGYGIKSLYANINRIEGQYHPDNKIFPSEQNTKRLIEKIQSAPYFSTSSLVPQPQKEIIMNLYPSPSPYEK